MLFDSQGGDRDLSRRSAASAAPARLTGEQAVEVWIARWLRIRPKDLISRYGCDPRRLYEIWEEERHAGSRAKALTLFASLHPDLLKRTDTGPHRRHPRRVASVLQPSLFPDLREPPGKRKGTSKP